MAVKIRLKRMGKIRAPFYRVVVMDSRTKRDGRAIEEIGKYHPTAEPSVIEIDSDRAQHWLSSGAQPTEAVAALLKVTGDWQKFKGLPGTEGTLRVAEPKKSKKELYESAVAAAGGSSLDVKDTPARKKAAPAKAAAPAKTAEAPAAEAPAPAAEAPAAEAPAAQAPAAEAPAAEAPAPETPAETAGGTPAETPAEPAPVAADTDSGAAAAESTDSSDDPAATTADADKSES